MSKLAIDLRGIGTPECREFAKDIFTQHKPISFYLRSVYVSTARQKGHVQANINLREMHQKLKWRMIGVSAIFKKVSVTVGPEEIELLALHQSTHCESIFRKAAKNYDLDTALSAVEEFTHFVGIPHKLVGVKYDKALGIVARLSDEQYWRRKIKVAFGRRLEQCLREMAFVCSKKGSPYVSKICLTRYRSQQFKNRKLIDSLECVRDDGVKVSLTDCVKASVSNPANRRNELMTRLSGFQEVAACLGYTGLFFTVTCPSRFHPVLKRGYKNSKYDNSNPRQANAYLNKVWAKVRATWAKKGIETFGFRIAEPHHDGTPHWHLVLWAKPESKSQLISVFKKYALQDSSEELARETDRIDVKEFNGPKDSIVGYVAKYVSKNVDGYAIDDDYEGETSANEGLERVRAWASIWGIRQFQQIGTVSVTVWRELRKKIEGQDYDQDDIKALRESADMGNWAEFVRLMGGATVRRNKAPIRINYSRSDTPNKYGEAVKKITGLLMQRVSRALSLYIDKKGTDVIRTRFYDWKIQHKNTSVLMAAKRPSLAL